MPSPLIKTTRIVMVVATILILLYDTIAAALGGREATISFQFGWLSLHWVYGAYLPFFWGFLAAHLLAEAQIALQREAKSQPQDLHSK